MKKKPIQQIMDRLSSLLTDEQVDKLPRKWEKIGDVLILRFERNLSAIEKEIAAVYAEVLNCKSVLKDTGGIIGQFRIPEISFVYGDKDTVTIHKENSVKYKLDPSEIMFSSGNMDERKRMGEIVSSDEVVVDLFAGIGYFSLPIAVHSKVKQVYSCELNPVAFSFLEENIKLNHVSDLITPVLGDNRKVAPHDIADRVLMGYIGETKDFLPTAFESLHNHKGIIHFHDTFPDEEVPAYPLSLIQKAAEVYHRSVTLQHVQCVKSFAPGVSHYVLDVTIQEK
ncbi:MAG: class I SAM-dependent methyltransferase family protein [Candidatus Thermoplasmatota archaeon]|nr:class I SAM-dependent methyltransferase family protein [Candidatus Thermoplasmatota archaeon]